MLKQSHFIVVTVNVEKYIINTICTKLHSRQDGGYNPNYLILWVGYKGGIQEILAHYDMVDKYYSVTIPIKIMGLNLIWTDIPDTIEVY